jgi:hypothetical protein
MTVMGMPLPTTTEFVADAQPDLPDVLGMITGGLRINIGLLQCAFALHPRATVLGQPLEALIVLQSAANTPLQLNFTVRLPKRDANGNRLALWTPKETIQLVLQPAETGLLHIPIVSRQPSQPATDLPVVIKVDVKAPRNAARIRSAAGGRPASVLNISPFRLSILREVGFRITQQEEAHLIDTFDVVAGNISTAQPPAAPRYETLWTAKDLDAERARFAELEAAAQRFAATLTRNQVFEQLERLIGDHFIQAGLPLHPSEAQFAAKTLTYTMEDGLNLEQGFSLQESRWFKQLVGMMGDAALLSDINALLTKLFPAIVHDSVRLGLSLVARIAEENLGTQAEYLTYADEVLSALQGKASIDLGHAYLPLVLTGLLLNYKVKATRENPWTSLTNIRQAWHGRLRLADDQFEWVARVFNLFYEEAETQLDDARISRPRPPKTSAATTKVAVARRPKPTS